ncbi:MAG: signal peptidase II [Lachnospiraceae bacterium]
MIALICIALMIVTCVIDLYLKSRVEKTIPLGKETMRFQGKIIVRHVHNHGMFLNLMDTHPVIVRGLSVILGVILVCYEGILFLKDGKALEKIGIAIFIGGAASNIYDRVKRGYVVDYFGVGTKHHKLSNVTFNLGDLCIFLGGIMVVLASAIATKFPKK